MATRVRRAAPTAVYLETGKQRVFACALDWPGWCRSGREQGGALEALAAYSPRYAAVAKEARMPFPSQSAEDFEIVERVPGSATTDFGARQWRGTGNRSLERTRRAWPHWSGPRGRCSTGLSQRHRPHSARVRAAVAATAT